MSLMIVALTASAAAWVLTPNGLGPVKIGMSQAQVARALGGKLVGQAIEDEAYCVEKSSSKGPRDVSYMFESGKLTRISAYETSPVKTPRGIGVGSSEAAVRAAYGKALEEEPHLYLGPEGRYLTFWLKGDARGVRFETDANHKVDVIHVGTGAIEYVEGCA